MKQYLYLDDERIPLDGAWIIVRNYVDFVKKVLEIGFDGIELISFDHDLGSDADCEWTLAKTGYDCAKELCKLYIETEAKTFPKITVHSANPVGALNIVNYFNSFFKEHSIDNICERVNIKHSIKKYIQ